MSTPNPPSYQAGVECVSRGFGGLQGLTLLPLAGVVAVGGAFEAHGLTDYTWWGGFVASVASVAVGFYVVVRGYRRLSGRVEP